ncbi:ornithine cyclodeaminase family protein [Loktanella sp. D2R18]|uniref:ornithine cyclodeaminase family protein n=1 Tax=Rhodobacterales TaxID=204455 RepID=UPI000DE8BD0F|nr:MULTISPECIES: ornithine cyclodeaminase family protein [Rhodobacterales]MDO6591114.1 ornithine cyclodeaminase family protein [Yoonia sp. 1_MG-2023]RBW42137.1 ornithine cyclodeaminase family protein [Loktanella sp. D2R18]
MLRVFDTNETRAGLEWPRLIDGLDAMFRSGCVMPLRHHHEVEVPNEDSGTLLLMPAWTPGKYIGVKMVNVIPGNSTRSLPAISGAYLLSSGETGALLAVLDGAELTARRTAAASALAARYLARPDARNLLVVGAGKLALNVIEAHTAVRPLTSVTIWARRIEQAQKVAKAARTLGYDAQATDDLECATLQADIISCCTLSRAPLIKGAWVKPGTHIDLIGAFKPEMRETDSALIAMASVFADTREGVLSEGGDIVQAIREGAFGASDIKADLFDLARGDHAGRRSEDEITVFKSVGAALEDLAAAILTYEATATTH